VKIPKLRSGSYFPPFLEPRRTAEKALAAVIQEAYVQGVSTRSLTRRGLRGVMLVISQSNQIRTHGSYTTPRDTTQTQYTSGRNSTHCPPARNLTYLRKSV
jgi:hypothetical protein